MTPAASRMPLCPLPELTLEGPADALLRSLDALRQVRDPDVPASILELGLIESLRLTEGEAWLRFVSLGMSCPLSELTADAAFRAIQAALPDTDIYLSLDHDVEWTPRRASVALRRRLGWGVED